jgi:hypothetical protein
MIHLKAFASLGGSNELITYLNQLITTQITHETHHDPISPEDEPNVRGACRKRVSMELIVKAFGCCHRG